MADPIKYIPGYSYSGWQTSNPTRPLPAPQVDNDFANIGASIGGIVDAVKDVRRSDGRLKNGIVTVEALESSLSALIAAVPGLAAQAAGSAASASAQRVLAEAAATRALENATQLVIASQAQAEAGAINDKGMTPLRTLQAIAEQAIQRQKIAKVITVGSGGDYATINDALKAASRLRPDYVSKGLSIEVRLLTGFVMAEQVFVVQEDMSFVTLTSVDAEVTIQRSAINQNNGNSANNWRTGTYPAFCAMRGGALPFIKALFAFDTSGTGKGTVGVYVFEGSRAVIARGCGFRNAGWRGLYADNGHVYARNSIWTGSGAVGGPDTASFAVGGYGIRCSNNGNAMCRGADVSGSYTGVYSSKGYVDCNDVNASNCTNIGFAATDHCYMTVSGANADGCAQGYRVDQGATLYGGESSDFPGAYPSALGCSGFPLVVQMGSFVGLDQPTFSSTGTNAILVRNADLRISGGSASTTASNKAAVLVDQTGDASFYNTKLEGTSYEIDWASGGEATVSGCTRADGVSAIRTRVNGGEFSPLGILKGMDGRQLIRTTDANFSPTADTPPEIVFTGALSQTRNVLMYLSDAAPWKRHTITHNGSGSNIAVYKETGAVNRLAFLAVGESVTIAPDGANGWFVVSRGRKSVSGRTVGTTSLTLNPSTKFIRSSGPIGTATSITMYAASDATATDHTFSRADAGVASWSVYEPDGTTLIVAVAANQWAQIVPRSDGTAWYVAAKGAL